MVQLISRMAQKANAPPLSDALRRKHDGAAAVTEMTTNGLFGGPAPARTSNGTEAILGGIGLAQRDNQRTVSVTKAETVPLHPKVAALLKTSSLSDNAARTLSLVVQLYELHGGDPVTFGAGDLASVLGIDVGEAGEIIDRLEGASLISRRLSSLGTTLGYAPTLPR